MIDAFVPLFYEKVLADDRINQFFHGVNMEMQGKLNTFLAMGFGGPNNYAGKDLREGHSLLVARGLNDGHYDNELVTEVMAAAEGLRADVLSK